MYRQCGGNARRSRRNLLRDVRLRRRLRILVGVLPGAQMERFMEAAWEEVENQALPGGTVVVVRADGAQVLTPTDESDLAKVLEHVLKP